MPSSRAVRLVPKDETRSRRFELTDCTSAGSLVQPSEQLTAGRTLGTKLNGMPTAMTVRAISFESPWNTGARILVEKYMTVAQGGTARVWAMRRAHLEICRRSVERTGTR